MAQKVEVRLEDDLDGGPAEHTVTFALDGKDYEIDLSHLRHPQRLDPPPSTDPDTAKIRAWAKDNGHPVSDRGRIHQSVKDAYYAAH